MRIVHVSYACVPEYSDPIQWLKKIQFYTGIVTEMAKHNDVVSVHTIGYEGIVDYEGATFHFLKASIWQRIFPFRTNRYVKNLKPDVVIVHGMHFLWSLFLLHFSISSRSTIFVQHHAEKPFIGIKKFFQKKVDKFISGYFFTSHELAKRWIETNQIQSLSKVHAVMEASSPFYLIDRATARKRTPVVGSMTYLWVGRLDTNKDPITLVRAFTRFIAAHSDAELYIIYNQSGELCEEVKLIVKDCPGIVLVGSVPHDELIYWFNSVDFIISTSHYESGGFAVCEGMSCGCVPILTAIPSFKMMTENGNCGLLFPAGDVEGLFQALVRSVSLDLNLEKTKTLDQFNKKLSFEAIADAIQRVVCRNETI
jgi:glycosyltransferase involved in cell wall biosynthesis